MSGGGAVELEIVVAILDKSRGFGYKNQLPWPYIKGDHEFYLNLTTAVQDPSKRNAYIMGHATWDSWPESERCHPRIFTVVTSSDTSLEGAQYLQKVCPSLEDAISYVTTPPVSDQIEKIFIMGGEMNYKLMVNDPRLKRVYVSRIFADLPADRFFPEDYEKNFKRVRLPPDISDSLQTDPSTGISYQFELWERISPANSAV